MPQPEAAPVAAASAPPCLSGGGSAAGPAAGFYSAGSPPFINRTPSLRQTAVVVSHVAAAAATNTAAALARASVARHGSGGRSARTPMAVAGARGAAAGSRRPEPPRCGRSRAPPPCIAVPNTYASMPGGGQKHRAESTLCEEL